MLNGVEVVTQSIRKFDLWEKLQKQRVPLSFDIELTPRCPNNCRHCYINLPVADKWAQEREMSPDEIDRIAAEAVALGAMWCLITGGEPLLRPDFPEIYTRLKRRGLLLSVFTTATMLTPRHIELFKRYPPRDIEITVYGITQATYERVTRVPGSFDAFRRGMNLLLTSGVKVRLKTMALRSNVDELAEIASFCRQHTMDFYRFDPLLHLRLDGNPARNREIMAERLSPDEIVALEKADPERLHTMCEDRDHFIQSSACGDVCNHLFHCGAGNLDFSVAFDGSFRLCSSLCAPGTTYDLRRASLLEAWNTLVPRVRELRSGRPEYLETCRTCAIINLCLHCPAHAYLETGALDGDTPYFCAVAHARAEMLQHEGALSSKAAMHTGPDGTRVDP